MKILVTGGCGFVGSNISIHLKKKLKNSKIYTLDNFSRKGSKINLKRLKLNNISNFKINISNQKKVMNLPKFDIIIDCCAEAAIEDSIKKPDKIFKTNLLGSFNIIKKCKKDNSSVIFLSSSRVYSIKSLRKDVDLNKLNKKTIKKFQVDENFDTESPKSLYGFSKLSSEDLIKEASYSYKIKYLINRFGVISGPWQFGYEKQGFVSLWVLNHVLKKNLKYIGFNGKGKQYRDVIHVDDVCDLILLQIKRINKIYNQTFNIGGGLKNLISLKELSQICEKVTGNKVEFSKIYKTSLFDIPIFLTNNKKIKNFYDWKPKINIKKIVIDIYDWAINNRKLIKRIYK